jgi:hypothetical protein
MILRGMEGRSCPNPRLNSPQPDRVVRKLSFIFLFFSDTPSYSPRLRGRNPALFRPAPRHVLGPHRKEFF